MGHPLVVKEALSLPGLGVAPENISFTHVTMDSDRFLCVRETGASNCLLVLDMRQPQSPVRRPIQADSVVMNPVRNLLALKTAIPGSAPAQDHLQVFDMDQKAKVKVHQMPERVVYWRWLNPTMMALVTESAVYKWAMEGAAEPEKLFDRSPNLRDNQIIGCRSSEDLKWFVVVGIAPGGPETGNLVRGNMQLFSVAQNKSQAIDGHAADISTIKVGAGTTTVFTFASKKASPDGRRVSTFHSIELGGSTFGKKQGELAFPAESADDFAVALHVAADLRMAFVLSKGGLLFLVHLDSAALICRARVSSDPVFLACPSPQSRGLYALNRKGQLLRIAVSLENVVPYISNQLGNGDMAVAVAKSCGLPGVENIIAEQFHRHLAGGMYKEAAQVAAESPMGFLRTGDTISKFKGAPAQPGQTAPLLLYFSKCLEQGKLNGGESIELVRLVVSQGKVHLIQNWWDQQKLTPSEALGDLLKEHNPELAVAVYRSGNAPQKVIAAFVQARQFDQIVPFCQSVNYTPDYLYILQACMMNDPQGAVAFAQHVSKTGGKLDFNTVADLFLQRNMVREATKFLLDVLEPDRPEDAMLQTKVLEINLIAFPSVADAILASNMFSHFDHLRIAQLCEKAGLFLRALEHYSDLSDIKRCIVNTQGMEVKAIADVMRDFDTDWKTTCITQLVKNAGPSNVEFAVELGKEFNSEIGHKAMVSIFDAHKCWQGIFLYLQNYANELEDKDLSCKYIESCVVVGNIHEVERATRELNHYDPDRIMRYLMEARLSDARALINVCDRHGKVPELTKYLYTNNLMRYLEGYVQKVSPGNTPEVVGTLLDCECDEGFIKNLMISVRSLIPVDKLTEEVEKRNKLRMLGNFLEHMINENSMDVHVHNALGKLIIESNNNPEHFLNTNQYYDSAVVGKFCERKDPLLACIAYKRGKCDAELVNVTNRNSLYKVQARYLVARQESGLWALVLQEGNAHRKQLVDQVVSTALPECKDPELVSATVKAFIAAGLSKELIELLEKIILQTSAFSTNPSLQKLLILTAVRSHKERVLEYINRLDAYDGEDIASVCLDNEMYEEALVVYKKLGMAGDAIAVLTDHMNDLARAKEYAEQVDDPQVWAYLAGALLETGDVKGAMAAFTTASDFSKFADVIVAANSAGDCFVELAAYLVQCRKGVKEPLVDTELVFAYANTGNIRALEDFVTRPNLADMESVGQRCTKLEMWEAAKVLFTACGDWGSLASVLVHLGMYQQAVETARKANSVRVWKNVCFACLNAGEAKLAQVCGLNVIMHVDELEEVILYYEERLKFGEIIAMLEAGVGVDRAHSGIFTETGILYAKYRPESLLDHIKLYVTRLNISRLIKTCTNFMHWKELSYLYVAYDEFDNAAITMMEHSHMAWEHGHFKDVISRAANSDMHYRAISFYLDEQPELLSDLLKTLEGKLDHVRTISLLSKTGHLFFAKSYLQSVQVNNLAAVNETLNEIYATEEDFELLQESVDSYDNFDALALAVKLQDHGMLEMRRVASSIFQKRGRFRQALDLCRKDRLFVDAIEAVQWAGDASLADSLVRFFVEDEGCPDCFAALLLICPDLMNFQEVIELGWINDMSEYATPFIIRETGRVHEGAKILVKEREDRLAAEAGEAEARENASAQQNQYVAMMQRLPALTGAPHMEPGGY